ncbi:MAG: adenosylcobinamide-phosphate synthase CbiB [Oscillospiraceae bacterium]|nr:adenosylcobinamide-phosphate synthase CbiB [Oscillospiraceae bacterium]
MLYHTLGFFGGFLLDLLLGDPHWMPHPVRLMGWLISFLERRLYPQNRMRSPHRSFCRGVILVLLVLLCTVLCAGSILWLCYALHPLAGMAAELLMTYQILATKCLKTESMRVCKKLEQNDLPGARKAVSYIVGRDTDHLSPSGVAKAAVETVAENTADGVIAPMLYTALGGPVLGLFYKAVNTMDSMMGYRNDRYLYFGRAAAKLDDALNFVPSRISAWLMIFSAFLGGKCFSGRRAFSIWKRDRFNHLSPNSAQTEAVCAGALGVQLGGDSVYFGKVVHKPTIGDDLRPIESEDIRRSNRLLLLSAVLGEGLCLLALTAITLIC